MSTPPDLSFAAIADVGARLRSGALSAVALTEHCLERIAALQPRLNAFITVTGDLAREQARSAERELRAGEWRGPLHGVPVAVKDFYDTAGIRTTAAFAPFERRVPSRDAELVTRLRDAGAVLVGKTNMHTLGQGTTSLVSHFGAVVNPWDADRVAGGSSGGSAAAIAAGLCFATVDTDAVGSGRLPAATCGVSCLKPTVGVLSSDGILAGEQSPGPAILALSTPSVMGRSADDVRLAFGALAGPAAPGAPEGDPAWQAPSPMTRLGLVTNYAADDEIRRLFAAVATGIATMKLATREVRVPFEKASFDVGHIESDRAAIDTLLFADVDALVLPTLAAPTPTVAEARARGDLAVASDDTLFANYFGLPAITVPAGVDRNGLPVGVQFVGPHGSDGRLLALADAWQRNMGWRYTPPPGATIAGG